MTLVGHGKIKKPESAAEPDALETKVAHELYNLEVNSDLKADLKELFITAAKEVAVGGKDSKAVIIFVPFKLLKQYHKIQSRLVRELEKKFSGQHVVIVAQRTMFGKSYSRSRKAKGPRPRSRTLTAVQEAILEDIVYPTEIVGKRTRVKLDGTKTLKVYLDAKDQVNIQHKLDTFSEVYKQLTHKDVEFLFPLQSDV